MTRPCDTQDNRRDMLRAGTVVPIMWAMRSRRRARSIVAALAAAAATTLAPAVDAQEISSPPAESALEALATCVQEEAYLSVLFLMDESGSLATTDPGGQRVVAASAALNTLAALGSNEVAGTQPTVEVAMAAFAADYSQVTEWALLDDSSRVGLTSTLNSFASRNSGIDTDFATALLGAEATLAQHRQLLDARHIDGCTALMLFTDGKLDIEARSTAETKVYAPDLPLDVAGNAALVEQRAVSTMCDPGGVVDRLREVGTTTLAIALTSAIDPADRDLIAAIAAGTSGATSCGTPTPSAGQYLEAADLAGLLSTFDTVAGTISGGAVDVEQAVTACGGAPCPSGTGAVAVDSSIRRLTVLVTSSSPTLQVHVTDPTDPTPAVFTREGSAATSTASADLVATWLSSSVLTIDIRSKIVPPPTGEWSFVVVDPSGQSGATATLQATRYGNLFPRLDDILVVGTARTATVIADIVDEFGDHVTDLPATTVINARITDIASAEGQDVVLSPSASGYLQGVVELPPTFGTTIEITITLTATTDAGVTLPTQTESTTHEIPAAAGGTAVVADTDLRPELEPAVEVIDEGSSVIPSGRTLGIVLMVAAVGALVLWLRKASSARFIVGDIIWTVLPVGIKPNGQLERLDRFAPLTIDPADFRPLDQKDNVSGFKLLDVRFRIRPPRHPFDPPIGIVRADVPVAGSKGVFDADVHGRGVVDVNLAGQWVFRIDEPATVASNRNATDPNYGEVLGHLVLLLPANHFKRPSPSLRRSLLEDLPAEARALLAGAKFRHRAKTDKDAGNTIGLIQSMLGTGDESPAFPWAAGADNPESEQSRA